MCNLSGILRCMTRLVKGVRKQSWAADSVCKLIRPRACFQVHRLQLFKTGVCHRLSVQHLKPFDPVLAARKLPDDKKTAGSRLFEEAGHTFSRIAPVLESGRTTEKEYADALCTLINTATDTAGLVKPPCAAFLKGLYKADQYGKVDDHIGRRARWMSFKHASGIDVLMFRASPTPVQLLQQAAFATCAVADAAAMPTYARPVIVDLLEEVFTLISDEKSLKLYQLALEGWSLEPKRFQFCLMRMLCVIYNELVAADRLRNLKYLFRHAEAAGILIVIDAHSAAGHLENARVLLLKITLGCVHVTPEVWNQAKGLAASAAGTAAHDGADHVFVPALYYLLFFMATGFHEDSFKWEDAQKILNDLDTAELRLRTWGLDHAVLFDCPPKQYLVALKDEWAKARGEKGSSDSDKKEDKSEGGKKGSKKRATLQQVLEEQKAAEAEKERAAAVPEGHLPATDWRVFDQRPFGFWAYLEPPMIQAETKCAQCGQACRRVHRCTTCKLVPYCSAICAQAHLFDHECHEAPKPWLAPPAGPAAKPPAELGEEGLFGFIPWHLVKYAVLAGLSYGSVWAYRRFDDFCWQNKYGMAEGLLQLFVLLWVTLRQMIEVRWHFVSRLVMGSGAVQAPPAPALLVPNDDLVDGFEAMGGGGQGACEGDTCFEGVQAS